MEKQFSKNQLIQVLTKSPHGKLEEYITPANRGRNQDEEFYAHLIAWNHQKGVVRDAKVALATLGLFHTHPEFTENAAAHLISLDPRNFVRALNFAKDLKTPNQHKLKDLVEGYIRFRESSFGLWERSVIQHRASMKTLYARWHIKPGTETFDKALFKGLPPPGSTLDIIKQLSNMSGQEALGHVLNRKIPFLVAVGALGKKIKDTDVVLALINSMSSTELQTNVKMLERLGINTNPALRAAFNEGLKKISEAKTTPILKTGVAAKALGGELGVTLNKIQEKALDAHGGIKGKWAILVDKSASMQTAIEAGVFIASHLARMAEEAHLIFFDRAPRYVEVTGKTLENIKEITRHVIAGGGTDCLIGLQYLLERGIRVDGVVLVSDGGHNYPQTILPYWDNYRNHFDHEPVLYFYKLRGQDPDTFSPTCEDTGIGIEQFDLTGGVDYYSLPNLISTMNTKRWTLIDQIMSTPLKSIKEVFTHH